MSVLIGADTQQLLFSWACRGTGNNPGPQRVSSLTWKAGTEKLSLLRPAKVPQLGPSFPHFLLPALRPCTFLGRCIHSWSSCPTCGATLPKQTGKSRSPGTCVRGVQEEGELVFWWYLDCRVCVLCPCTVVKRAVGTIPQPQPREGGAGSTGRVPSVS